MKQPWYKVAISHFWDVPVETTSSQFNPLLRVLLSRGRYQLTTRNAVYSFADLYDNFRVALAQVKWETWHGRKVLVLGLGLGSIPYMLEKHFGQSMEYTAVEIDEEVVYLANKYVLRDLDSPMTIFTADAALYVSQCSEKFDLICVDVFEDDEIPADFRTREFLGALSRLLTDQGMVMYNVLSRTNADVKLAWKFLTGKFLQVYPAGGYIETTGNWVLINRTDLVEPELVVSSVKP